MRLIHSHDIQWKGVPHRLELFASSTLPTEHPLTQCQTVALVDPHRAVVYLHQDGYFGLPGGHIENGEDPVECLRRELAEECGCALVTAVLVGFLKDTNLATKTVEAQPRFLSLVTLEDRKWADPDGKALSRELVAVDELAEILSWGLLGQELVALARSALPRLSSL